MSEASMLSKIEFPEGFKGTKYRWSGTHLLEGKLPGNELTAVGIDPGVNFGMTVINREYVQVVWGKLPRQEKKGWHGIDAFDHMVEYFGPGVDRDLDDAYHGMKAVVEGASYRSQFGQVGLEEVRFGFFFGLYKQGFDVSIVPPATIRKEVSGSGKTQAMDIWPLLKHDACDSIFCALYALGQYG